MEQGKYRTVVAPWLEGSWMLLIVGSVFCCGGSAANRGCRTARKLRLQRLRPRRRLPLRPHRSCRRISRRQARIQRRRCGPIRPAPTPASGRRPPATAKATSRASCQLTDLYDRIAHNLYLDQLRLGAVAGFLVMFMQAGFMFVETGLCRAKNAAHTAAMNFMIYPLGCLGFWVYGFAIGWGNWWNGPVPPGWYPSLGPGLRC